MVSTLSYARRARYTTQLCASSRYPAGQSYHCERVYMSTKQASSGTPDIRAVHVACGLLLPPLAMCPHAPGLHPAAYSPKLGRQQSKTPTLLSYGGCLGSVTAAVRHTLTNLKLWPTKPCKECRRRRRTNQMAHSVLLSLAGENVW